MRALLIVLGISTTVIGTVNCYCTWHLFIVHLSTFRNLTLLFLEDTNISCIFLYLQYDTIFILYNIFSESHNWYSLCMVRSLDCLVESKQS